MYNRLRVALGKFGSNGCVLAHAYSVLLACGNVSVGWAGLSEPLNVSGFDAGKSSTMAHSRFWLLA